MLGIVIAFIAGSVVMDFAWAWRMGMVQRIWRRMFPAPVNHVTYEGCPYCEHCQKEEEIDQVS